MCSAPKVTQPAQTLLPPAVPPAPLEIPGSSARRSVGLSALRIGQKLTVAPSPTAGLTIPPPAATA